MKRIIRKAKDKLQLTTNTGFNCPKCNKIITLSGFWSALFLSIVITETKKRGGFFTCPNCKEQFEMGEVA